VSGGKWNYDDKYLELTDNNDGTAKITGLKVGKTTVTYTASGHVETFIITINATSLPSTGQDFTWVWVFGLAATIVSGLTLLIMRKHKSHA
jgi:LPXTG-motif cell wall-anchored protein